MRRVRDTIVALEKQSVLHNLIVCICSLRYLACNAHEPYFHLWAAQLYSIFPNYRIKGTISKKKVIGHKMCVLTLFTNLYGTFLILRRYQ